MSRFCVVPAVVVLAVAGCGSQRPAPPPATNSTPAATAAPSTPSFDGLFALGAHWRFRIEVITDDEIDASRTGYTTCRVTATSSFPGGRASEVECDEDPDPTVGDKVAGVWIQTEHGLWHELTMPEQGVTPVLEPDGRLLPAPLVAAADGTVATEPDEELRRGDVSTEIRAEGDAWCVFSSFGGGDTSWDELCLDADGPVSGRAGHGSDQTHEVRFELADE